MNRLPEVLACGASVLATVGRALARAAVFADVDNMFDLEPPPSVFSADDARTDLHDGLSAGGSDFTVGLRTPL